MGDKFYIIHSGRVGVYKNVKSEIGIVILVSIRLFLIVNNFLAQSRWT